MHAGERAFDVCIWPAVQVKLFISAATVQDGPITAERIELHALLQEHSDILTNELPAGVPRERATTGEVIPEVPGSQPCCAPPYRLSPAEKAEVLHTCVELLAKGSSALAKARIVRPSRLRTRRMARCICA